MALPLRELAIRNGNRGGAAKATARRAPSSRLIDPPFPSISTKCHCRPAARSARARTLSGWRDYVREEILPPALSARGAGDPGVVEHRLQSDSRIAALLRAARSVWFRCRRSTLAQGLAGERPAHRSSPRPCGQLFLSARPELIGVADPVPEDLRVFVLPGSQRYVRGIDWNEFEPQLAVRVATEHAARVDRRCEWLARCSRSVISVTTRAKTNLVFSTPLSIALGYAARSAEPADEIVGAMHAIVSAHADLTNERRDRYTQPWLRRELLRLRAKDAARDARSDAMRKRLFPAMRLD